jgi:hypothetical protein
MSKTIQPLFSKDFTLDEIRKLIKQFRYDCEESSFDIWGDYYYIEVDSYFEHQDDEIMKGCIDIFGVKLLNVMEGADTVLLHDSYLRVIDNLLKLRDKKGIRILLLIRFIDFFRKYAEGSSNWYGKNSTDREEQETYQKSKEIFSKINQLDLTLSNEEINYLKQNYANLDSFAMIYLKSSERAQL